MEQTPEMTSHHRAGPSRTRRWLTSPKTWQIILILVVLGGGLWIWVSRVEPDEAVEIAPAPRTDAPAPAFTAPLLEGGTLSLSDYRGQVIVLNMWASWCHPCRAEMPALQHVWERYQDQELLILGLNQMETVEEINEFLEEYELTFPIALDSSGEIGMLYRLDSYPTTFFIDREGVIRDVVRGGPMPEALIDSTVRSLLEEGQEDEGEAASWIPR